MNNPIVLSALGIGIAIIVAFFILWHLSVYFKKRIKPDHLDLPLLGRNHRLSVERRGEPRRAVPWEARLHTFRGTMEGQLKDISSVGAFVACEDPLSPKEPFRVDIKLPDGSGLELEGEVVWSNANVPEEKVVLRGMGVRFVRVSERERKVLDKALSDVEEPG